MLFRPRRLQSQHRRTSENGSRKAEPKRRKKKDDDEKRSISVVNATVATLIRFEGPVTSEDYDLCEACHRTGVHTHHTFREIEHQQRRSRLVEPKFPTLFLITPIPKRTVAQTKILNRRKGWKPKVFKDGFGEGAFWFWFVTGFGCFCWSPSFISSRCKNDDPRGTAEESERKRAMAGKPNFVGVGSLSVFGSMIFSSSGGIGIGGGYACGETLPRPSHADDKKAFASQTYRAAAVRIGFRGNARWTPN